MSMTDPIADMLTRIRNAQQVGKKQVSMPSSKIKASIANVFKLEGYIDDYLVGSDTKPLLSIDLRYLQGHGVIDRLERLSRPGLRVYKSCQDFPSVLNGMGILVVSTAHGVMSDRDARARHLGGELLCLVA